MIFIYVKQRRAIYSREHWDMTDDARAAVVFDGAAIFDVLVANKHDAVNRQARVAQSASVRSV